MFSIGVCWLRRISMVPVFAMNRHDPASSWFGDASTKGNMSVSSVPQASPSRS
jgi:hypothetical protein